MPMCATICALRVRPETLEHALNCTARLIRVLLGPTAVADKKLEFSKRRLDILGVTIKLSRRGFSCRPTKRKVAKWCDSLQRALDEDRLRPGDASKLAGKLSWGCATMFRHACKCSLGGLVAVALVQESRQSNVAADLRSKEPQGWKAQC